MIVKTNCAAAEELHGFQRTGEPEENKLVNSMLAWLDDGHFVPVLRRIFSRLCAPGYSTITPNQAGDDPGTKPTIQN